ncbi:MAG: Rne/Rng family ribonuclease [Planctomycetota bacterium]
MPKTEMLINYVPGEECRIAIVEDGRLEEFYQERASTESHVSNIYKGRVTNVEPAIQAAFIDFGLERNGFLHISDLHPKYFPGKDREEFEKVGHKTARHERPPIQKCLKRGQEVLVQVLKEGIGTKGPTLTSYLSIPGRFLVMMPDMQRLGVSRKVDDDDARKETKDILKALDPPKEFGFIVRTAGIGQTKTDLKRDLSYLQRLWKNIERKRKQRGKTGELYAESDLVIRTIRDVFNSDIDHIVCDDLTAARRARDFLAVANPRSKSKVIYYDDPVPLFHRRGVEQQLDNMNAREVPLPSGGALVIDQTEALVAIDVNSGKSRAAKDAETNAYKTNLEAVDEIARQLRLRDLGGLVVLDLIDMRPMKNRKAVESRFRNNLKKDRARTRIGPISQFGLLEMTRQRMRASLRKSIHQECTSCNGRGYSMSPESVILSVMRRLALVMNRDDVDRIELTISPDVAFHILNRKRGELVALEKKYGKTVMVRVGGNTIDFVNIAVFNAAGITLPSDPESLIKHIKPAGDKSFRELVDAELPEHFEEEQPEEPEAVAESDEDASEFKPATAATDDDDEPGKPKRSGRRRRKSSSASAGEAEATSEEAKARPGDDRDEESLDEDGQPKRRRRRRRGGRGRKKNADAQQDGAQDRDNAESAEREPAEDAVAPDTDSDTAPDTDSEAGADTVARAADKDTSATDTEANGEDAPKKKSRRRRRGRRKSSSDEDGTNGDVKAEEGLAADEPVVVEATDEAGEAASPTNGDEKPKRKRRRSGRTKKSAEANGEPAAEGKSPKGSKKKTRSQSRPRLPLDEHGDVNGNVKLPEDGESATGSAETEVDGNVPTVVVKKKSTKKKPPTKPGRGYANRIISG